MAHALTVHFDEVSKTYRRGDQEILVLDQVTFEVPAGEFVALMGPSGSGKSTLLNLVAGLDRPSAGHVTLGRFEPAVMSEGEGCRWRSRHVGFIFQRYHLL